MISFKGKNSPEDMILGTVRWYVACSLSYRDVEKILAERGASAVK